MRLSPDDAVALGLIDKDTATRITQSGRRGTPVISKAVAQLNGSKLVGLDGRQAQPKRGSNQVAMVPSPAPDGLPSPGSREYRELATSPQKILFDALCERLPGQVVWEAEGLIPGRKFSVDIFIPPCTIVEFDGFRFHKSKAAYQGDRDRQNLFVSHGFRPIRAFAKQIFNKELLDELVELIVKTTALS